MVRNISYMLFFTMLLSCGICLDNIKLNNIKYFRTELLENISTEEEYKVIQLYVSDRNFGVIRDLPDTSLRWLHFQQNGYILSNNSRKSEKYKYKGVLYQKNNQVYVDLIGGTQDGCLILDRYKVKIVDDKLYLLEDDPLFNYERICYVMFSLSSTSKCNKKIKKTIRKKSELSE